MKIEDLPAITFIARNLSIDQTMLVASQMVETGIRSIEVSLVGADALDCIRILSREYGSELRIGAGTVLSLNDAVAAIDAGASFLLSPVRLPREVMEFARERGVLSIPSGLTPTEIHDLFSAGADIVKVFPAVRMSPAYMRDLMAPLGDLPLMAVGGIDATNVREYLDAGARFAGIGSGCFQKEDLERMDVHAVRCSLDVLERTLLEPAA